MDRRAELILRNIENENNTDQLYRRCKVYFSEQVLQKKLKSILCNEIKKNMNVKTENGKKAFALQLSRLGYASESIDNTMPPELLSLMFIFLEIRELSQMTIVCKNFKKLIENHLFKHSNDFQIRIRPFDDTSTLTIKKMIQPINTEIAVNIPYFWKFILFGLSSDKKITDPKKMKIPKSIYFPNFKHLDFCGSSLYALCYFLEKNDSNYNSNDNKTKKTQTKNKARKNNTNNNNKNSNVNLKVESQNDVTTMTAATESENTIHFKTQKQIRIDGSNGRFIFTKNEFITFFTNKSFQKYIPMLSHFTFVHNGSDRLTFAHFYTLNIPYFTNLKRLKLRASFFNKFLNELLVSTDKNGIKNNKNNNSSNNKNKRVKNKRYNDNDNKESESENEENSNNGSITNELFNNHFKLYFPCLETLILVMPTTTAKFDTSFLFFPACNTLKNIHLLFQNFPINAERIEFHESLNIENLRIDTGYLSSMNYNSIECAFQIATKIKHLSNLIIDPSFFYASDSTITSGFNHDDDTPFSFQNYIDMEIHRFQIQSQNVLQKFDDNISFWNDNDNNHNNQRCKFSNETHVMFTLPATVWSKGTVMAEEFAENIRRKVKISKKNWQTRRCGRYNDF